MNRSTLMTALPIGVAVLLMGVSCYYQGKWSERWGEFPELDIFATQLSAVPQNVGEWRGEEQEKTDERILKLAGAAGELNRVYRNAAGEEVRVMLMCARFRDVFYHSPERCYPAAGFETQGEPQREIFEINGKEAQFFTTTFLKSEPTGTHAVRGFWAWMANGPWLAPTNEKLAFAGERALYKLYVFANTSANDKGRTDYDFCSDFIRVFLPALDTALRPGLERAERVRRGEADEATPQPAEPPAAVTEPAEPPAADTQPAAVTEPAA